MTKLGGRITQIFELGLIKGSIKYVLFFVNFLTSKGKLCVKSEEQTKSVQGYGHNLE